MGGARFECSDSSETELSLRETFDLRNRSGPRIITPLLLLKSIVIVSCQLRVHIGIQPVTSQ